MLRPGGNTAETKMQKNNEPNDHTVRREELIKQIVPERPHLVILGAGASRAAFPEGDKYGHRLPLMNDFIEVLGLESFLRNTGIEFNEQNFEVVYNQIYENPKLSEFRINLEKNVFDYFDSLEIPDHPTIYDHLLLSLRPKDIVATFNWDPFLVQAYDRNIRKVELPKILCFLHGNVAVGFCESDGRKGDVYTYCKACHQKLQSTKLLYPISRKNYQQDRFIKHEWELVESGLAKAFMLTIFGYGAPQSDVEAQELMRRAWGEPMKRRMEQVEIIDIKRDEELYRTWKPFIYESHYEHHKDFYDSSIARFPRRTGEARRKTDYIGGWVEENPIPRNLDFPELWDWLQPLIEAENSSQSESSS